MMGTIADDNSALLRCSLCGDLESDMYTCDECGRVMCEDCKATFVDDDDIPSDYCHECVELG